MNCVREFSRSSINVGRGRTVDEDALIHGETLRVKDSYVLAQVLKQQMRCTLRVDSSDSGLMMSGFQDSRAWGNDKAKFCMNCMFSSADPLHL
jgi:hypothetical protein